MLFGGDRERLETYIRQMAALMGLKDWEISLEAGNPENENHAACCATVYGRRILNIWFREGWEEWDGDELRVTVIHELLHAYHNPLRGPIDNLQPHIGGLAHALTLEAYNDLMEVAIDSIATAWAETLPLPTGEPQQEAA